MKISFNIKNLVPALIVMSALFLPLKAISEENPLADKLKVIILEADIPGLLAIIEAHPEISSDENLLREVFTNIVVSGKLDNFKKPEAIAAFEVFCSYVPKQSVKELAEDRVDAYAESGFYHLTNFFLKNVNISDLAPEGTLIYGSELSLLSHVVLANEKEIFNLLLDYGVNFKDESLIHIALTYPDIDKYYIKTLLIRGLDPKIIFDLPRNITFEGLNLLMELGIKPPTETLKQYPSLYEKYQGPGDLFLAIQDKNLKDVKNILVEFPRLVNIKNKQGYTPAFFTILHGTKEIFEYLISQHANLHDKISGGRTPLMLAAQRGKAFPYFETISPIDLYYMAKDVDDNRWTAIMHSALRGDLEGIIFLASAIESKISEITEPEEAVRKRLEEKFWNPINSGDKQKIKDIISDLRCEDRGPDKEEIPREFLALANKLEKNGNISHEYYENVVVPLAIKVVSEAFKEDMAEIKEPLNYQDNENGLTALMIAVANGHTNVAKYLLEIGADPNTRSQDNWTAIMLAYFHENDELVGALLKAGATFTEVEKLGVALAERAYK